MKKGKMKKKLTRSKLVVWRTRRECETITAHCKRPPEEESKISYICGLFVCSLRHWQLFVADVQIFHSIHVYVLCMQEINDSQAAQSVCLNNDGVYGLTNQKRN